MKNNYVFKSIVLAFLFLSACSKVVSYPSCNDSNDNDSYIYPSEEVSDNISEDVSEENPYEGYHKLCKGLYVNYLPGIFKSGFKLEFKVEPGYELLFSTNDTKSESYSIYRSPLKIESKLLPLEDYPLTTSVDAILAGIDSNHCVSNSYINNIQKTNKYVLYPKQTVITPKLRNSNGVVVYNVPLTYIVSDKDLTVPVISLNMPYSDWFDPNYGIYNQIRQELESRVNLEYFDPVYNESFQRNSKIKIGGNWSKGYPQRTLNLNFNKDEKGNKNERVVEHVFGERTQCGFHDQRLTNLSRFRLHNGGNCFEDLTGLNDAMMHEIMFGTNISTGAFRPSIVYLNGEYWGYMAIREHYSDTYFEDNYGVSKKNVVVYQYTGSFVYDDGDNKSAGDAMLNDLNNHLKNFTNLDIEDYYNILVDNYIDVDSLIDAIIVESYSGNWDFVGNGNNLKMWASVVKSDSNKYMDKKFRFCLHDIDFACSGDTRIFMEPDVDYSYNKMTLVKRLLTSHLFREKLYNRAVELMHTNLSSENCISVLNRLVMEIEPYKYESQLRWGASSSYYTNWLDQVNATYNFFRTRSSTYLGLLRVALDRYE